MKGVIRKSSALPGKNVVILGGVHGNERVGVEAVRWAAATIEPARGTIYFVEANLPAIEKNVRLIEKNLNRCFLKGNAGTTPEDIRARELMSVFDECDALLDIHSSNNKSPTPFVICEPTEFEFARTLDFPIVSSGWDAIEPGGTDGYMFNQQKPGICIECGSVFEMEANLERAKKSILQFLGYFNVIDAENPISIPQSQRYIQAYKVAHKKTSRLVFTRDYADFEPLEENEVFATDGEIEYRATKGDCIIFPHPDTIIGGEAFILGREVVDSL